ncbi:uncharacterized protein PGTG_21949 [Puccinia graminis f. sp. tritici CRL 75-36-700-3]|uniref:Uncharacterized protein n=1 Tax=Puccinia graminis f. sp. tritici (strain CRL 75-36-700-3 / race SCCL) TaxID=418459 RepID=H6QSX8_PUCGT|nr:uncharacterized protein PGTG_21949 [Puccinia graminis f. sp. tritici CRL 75-36-700-3]EHS63932.1 hypothetical protein PGTG_21949 [Puccinia graminis f. sp. tritici CRL 75-36-700-3]
MALDLFPESAEPKPKLNEALDVVSRLNTALNTLSISVCTLSPTIYSLGRKSSRIDQTYGVLKRFRCYILEMDVNELISQDLPELFLELSQFVSSGEYAQGGSEFSDEEYASKLLSRRTQLFATIDKIQSAIDTSLRLMDRSDFGILRHIWTEFDTELGDSLAQIAQRIHEAKDLEVPPADHPFNLRPRIIHLLEQIVPLVKLARVFYRKIGSGPPFTFGEDMCSADLELIRRGSGMINNNLSHIVNYLLRTYRAQTVERGGRLPIFSNAVKEAMKDTLDFIASHMVPSDPARTVDDIMEESFGILKSQFNPTYERFLAAVNEFESVNQRFINEADVLDQQ